MKRNILLGTLSILLAVGCGKTPQSSEETPEATPGATALESAPATPFPHHFAPTGVFFLTEKIKLETPDGVLGYPPGTKVIQVSGAYVTPDGKRIAARADQMTNDLEVAQQLAGRDAAAQAAIKNTLGSLAPAGAGAAGGPLPPGSRSTTFSTITTGPNGDRSVRETTTVHTTSVNPVTAQIRDLEKQKQLLFLQIDEQHAALRGLTNKNPRKSPEAELINQQIASLREQIRNIDGQLAVVRASR
jgi:hypothetical protein